MSDANENSQIQSLYDDLFEQVSHIVASGETHIPIIVVLDSLGPTHVIVTTGLTSDQRASLFLGLGNDPKIFAAALIVETWYADADLGDTALLDMACRGRLSEYVGRKEAIVISILTPLRQAVMVCEIDRATKTLQKAPLQWTDDQGAMIHLSRYVRACDEVRH